MKKFLFSLETLLQVCKQKEEIAQKELLKAQLHFQEEIRLLEEIQKKIEFLNRKIRETQLQDPILEDLKSYRIYLESELKKLTLQYSRTEKACRHLENKRNHLILTMQKRKVIENLKEKKFDEWVLSGQNQEKKSFDELSTMHYARQQNSLHKKDL